MAERKGIKYRIMGVVTENEWAYQLAVCPACGRDHYYFGDIDTPSQRTLNRDPETDVNSYPLLCADCYSLAERTFGKATVEDCYKEGNELFLEETVAEMVRARRLTRLVWTEGGL